MLLEGMSIRACERLTGVKRDTICDLVLLVGENCRQWMQTAVVGVEAKEIQLDEIWDFIRLKDRTKKRLGQTGDDGDSWTWLAIDSLARSARARLSCPEPASLACRRAPRPSDLRRVPYPAK